MSAASYVAAKGDPYDAGFQPWSDSVKALAHYPEIVEWLAENLTWVQAVGAAFASDPADVMQSIQRLRARARDLGTLVDTPQQQVVDEDGLIEILPADADVIYVPRYDPSVVFLQPFEPGGASFIGFGPPFRSGAWLTYGFDWHRHALWVGRFTRDGQGWQRPNFFGPGAHVWHPPAQRPFPENRPARPSEPFVRPNLLPGAPAAPRQPPDDRWNRSAPAARGQRAVDVWPASGAPGEPAGRPARLSDQSRMGEAAGNAGPRGAGKGGAGQRGPAVPASAPSSISTSVATAGASASERPASAAGPSPHASAETGAFTAAGGRVGDRSAETVSEPAPLAGGGPERSAAARRGPRVRK